MYVCMCVVSDDLDTQPCLFPGNETPASNGQKAETAGRRNEENLLCHYRNSPGLVEGV